MSGIVYVVDADPSFRIAIEQLLTQAGYRPESYASASEFLDRAPESNFPGCILLAVRLPGMTGPELQASLIEKGCAVPIIFVTAYPETGTAVRAIKAGAEEFLTKPINSDELLAAIEKAVERHRIFLAGQTFMAALRGRSARLTPRERQVFELVVCGNLNKQIAYQLGMSVRTVKAHRSRVMEKMQVRTLVELVSVAQQLRTERLVAPEDNGTEHSRIILQGSLGFWASGGHHGAAAEYDRRIEQPRRRQ
jgi:FixJ family two-component response regulator